MDDETASEIMQATHRALCEYGYAGLTMQRIADESSMSSAAIHYHFDTKKELLDAFLRHLTEQFERRLACAATDPRERLATFLDAVFTPADDHDSDFPIAIMELKAQAPYQTVYRDRFHELDETIRDVVASAVRDGVEAGYFDDADPGDVARVVITIIDGGHTREVALGEDPTETRRVLESYLQQRLGWTPEVVA